MIQHCRICGIQADIDRQGRCRLCREAKAASDAGISYGRYKSIIFMRYGDQPEIPPDWYRECPVCHRIFLPSRKNKIYDSAACAQRAASKNYYKRQRAGRRAPAEPMEDTDGADAADQISRRAHKDELVPENQKK